MGMQGTSTYIVKTILNMFINKYMFANLYQVDHFDLFILQTAESVSIMLKKCEHPWFRVISCNEIKPLTRDTFIGILVSFQLLHSRVSLKDSSQVS